MKKSRKLCLSFTEILKHLNVGQHCMDQGTDQINDDNFVFYFLFEFSKMTVIIDDGCGVRCEYVIRGREL